MLTVDDGKGGTGGDTVCVTVIDTTSPEIACNAPSNISPNVAPITFTATAKDVCQGNTAVEITMYECVMSTMKGKKISKLESCEVSYADGTLSIANSGGVGTTIIWDTYTTDPYGNTAAKECVFV